MYIKHNRRANPRLSAALMTRDVACGMYPPGSDGWNRWGCGASAPPPPPQPRLTDEYTPPMAPAPPTMLNYDADYARRVQDAENAQITAQLTADEQAREATAQAAKAAEAQRKLDAMYASNAAAMSASDAGGAGFSSFSAETDAAVSTMESNNKAVVYALFAAVAVAVVALSKKRSK